MADDEKVGWEVDGEFVPIAFNATHGKDLMLLDRIAQMSVEEFLDAVDAGTGRAPVMMTMLATSIRAARPDWSVDRIYRLVTGELSGMTFVAPDPDGDAGPPADGSEKDAPSDEPATSSSAGSSPSPTPTGHGTEPLTSEPSYAVPA